jgi:hypothetical protein
MTIFCTNVTHFFSKTKRASGILRFLIFAHFMVLKTINLILRIALGAVFIASALLKLNPIELFEFNFVNVGVANWYTAPFIARLLIAFEYSLGFMLIFNVYLLRFTLKAALLLLAFFTAYLCIQILSQGNEGNCGCFGTYLQMTPLQSIIKNAIMMVVAYWLFYTKAQFNLMPTKFRAPDGYIALAIILTATATPFVLNPVKLNAPQQFDKTKTGYILNLSELYSPYNKDKPDVDLRRGKHILALMTLTCPHCRTAAFKMHIMHQRHPEIPFYFLLSGNEEKYLDDFYAETRAKDIDHVIYNTPDFIKLAGDGVPAIFWLDNGTVVKRSNLLTLNESEILEWLKKKP